MLKALSKLETEPLSTQKLCLSEGQSTYWSVALYWDWGFCRPEVPLACTHNTWTCSMGSWNAEFGLQLGGSAWVVSPACTHCRCLGPAAWYCTAPWWGTVMVSQELWLKMAPCTGLGGVVFEVGLGVGVAAPLASIAPLYNVVWVPRLFQI